jgi:recombination protein RecR
MILRSPSVERLLDAFRKLPGVGRRTAERMTLHVLSAPEEVAMQLSDALRDARQRIRNCSVCCNLTETDPCPICTAEDRDRSVVCVVEQPSGVMAIEKGGGFRGLYHVLQGVLNPLDGVGPDELSVAALRDRIASGEVREVIVATNATAEGEATALYLSRVLTNPELKVSRIAHGVPMGGDLEYADEVTLGHAIEGRTTLS